jgi:hypothetical protein
MGEHQRRNSADRCSGLRQREAISKLLLGTRRTDARSATVDTGGGVGSSSGTSTAHAAKKRRFSIRAPDSARQAVTPSSSAVETNHQLARLFRRPSAPQTSSPGLKTPAPAPGLRRLFHSPGDEPAETPSPDCSRQPGPSPETPAVPSLHILCAGVGGSGDQRDCGRGALDEVVESSQPSDDDGSDCLRKGRPSLICSHAGEAYCAQTAVGLTRNPIAVQRVSPGGGPGPPRQPTQLLSAQRAFIAKLPAVSRQVDNPTLRGSGLAGQLQRAQNAQQAERMRWEKNPHPGMCLEVSIASREFEAQMLKCHVMCDHLPSSFPPQADSRKVPSHPFPFRNSKGVNAGVTVPEHGGNAVGDGSQVKD